MMETAAKRPLPKVVAQFDRNKFVEYFSPSKHIATSLSIAIPLLLGAAALSTLAQPMDWLFLIPFFLVANFVEWAFHKNPMHHPKDFPPGARVLYVNHTLVHHRAFLPNTMPIRHTKDLGLILMPWFTMLILMGLGLPAALIGWALRGPGVVGIFYVFALLYYMSYEVLHGMYHTNEATQRRYGLWNNKLFQFLRSHHAHHHRLDRMSKVNFNVTLPLADYLTGTRETPDLATDDADSAEAWERGMDDKERATVASAKV